ncbi:MAG: P-loop NTPase fold protein [Patescibacteria group bacterium]
MKGIIAWLKRLLPSKKEEAQPVSESAGSIMPEAEEKSTYSADKPIETIDQDRFNRWAFARRIADTLSTRTDPSSVVVGVYGPWGDGKTSVLRLMEIALANHPKIIPVRFNPWYFGSQEQLLQGFFKTVAEAAGKSLVHNGEKFGKFLEQYGSLLSLASLSLSGGIVSVGSGGEAAVGLGNALSTVDLDKRRERLEKILEETDKRIIVMIDDIDRLDQDEIHAIFKLVKLSAGFNRTSYVLALDDEMVSGALSKKYGSGNAQAGRNFLEKIVQVPLHVPAADEIELRRVTLEGVDAALKLSEIELSQEQADTFTRHFVDGIEERILTPRQAKLYANAITFALPILKGEVNPVDHMLIEGIRVFYPKLYVVIRENPSFFLEAPRDEQRGDVQRQRIHTLIDTALKEAGIEDPVHVKDRLIKPMFPRAIGNVSYGSEWDKTWAKEQKICSSEYFKRYFQYSVPAGDVPDLATETFLKDIGTKTDSEIDETIMSFSGKNGLASLVKKLRNKETTIDPDIAPKLALGFARAGAFVPREKAMFSDWSFSQAAILVSALVKRVPAGKRRDDLARELMRSATPLAFAFECLRWLGKDPEDKDDDRVLLEAMEKEIGAILAERIKEDAAKGPLYKTYGSDTPRLFWAWHHYGNQAQVKKYLEDSFDAQPNDVYDFLDTYVGVSWGIENGLPSRSEFQRESYNSIEKMISPDFIMAKLRIQFGSELDNPEYYQTKDTPIQKQLAHQFAICHSKAVSERKPPDPPKSPLA